MSLGFTGSCKVTSEDDNTMYYAYSGADWNNPTHAKDAENALDGVLAVDKAVLQWTPSQPRKQTEHIDWAHSAIAGGQAVVISECKNAFRRGDGSIDYIVLRLLYRIFEHLLEHATLPDSAAFIQ